MDINFKLIGKRIKYYRTKENMSQMDLAEFADLSVPYISFIETGRKKVSLISLLKIATALNITPNHILTDYIVHSEDTIATEITTLLKECNSDERFFLHEMLLSIVRCLRSSHWFHNRNKD